MQAMAGLAVTVSHEVNQPLSSLQAVLAISNRKVMKQIV
jgi:hypothetical protein